jgi:hypothetical protein
MLTTLMSWTEQPLSILSHTCHRLVTDMIMEISDGKRGENIYVGIKTDCQSSRNPELTQYQKYSCASPYLVHLR